MYLIMSVMRSGKLSLLSSVGQEMSIIRT